MKVLTCFLVFAFLVSSLTPGALYAGGGGGCGDSEGCNNTMYGIAIGTTLLLVGYLFFQHKISKADDNNKEKDSDTQDTSSIQPQNPNDNNVSPAIVVYRW